MVTPHTISNKPTLPHTLKLAPCLHLCVQHRIKSSSRQRSLRLCAKKHKLELQCHLLKNKENPSSQPSELSEPEKKENIDNSATRERKNSEAGVVIQRQRKHQIITSSNRMLHPKITCKYLRRCVLIQMQKQLYKMTSNVKNQGNMPS